MSRIWRLLSSALLLALVGSATPGPAPASSMPARSKAPGQTSLVSGLGPIPAEYFGMHAHPNPDLPLAFSEVPFGIFRLWDSGTSWANLEPEKGQWTWDRLDTYVALAQEKGTPLILTLGMTPFWASSDPSQLSPYGESSCAPPTSLSTWEAYVRALAERNEARYAGAIRVWEVWNEPDHPTVPFYCGTIPELVDLAEVAHAVLKEVNPANQVLAPSVTQVGGPWLKNYLEAGGAAAADIIGFHFYWDWYAPNIEAFRSTLDAMKLSVRRGGAGNKPLWLTETGISMGYYGTLAEQERGLLELLVAPRAFGLPMVGIYAWNNGSFTQLYNAEVESLTDLGASYQVMQPWLLGAQLEALALTSGRIRVGSLSRGGGVGHVLWSETGQTGSYSVPTGWGDILERLDGSQEAVPASRVVWIGWSPILIRDQAYGW